jgi:hypothetical protein
MELEPEMVKGHLLNQEKKLKTMEIEVRRDQVLQQCL